MRFLYCVLGLWIGGRVAILALDDQMAVNVAANRPEERRNAPLAKRPVKDTKADRLVQNVASLVRSPAGRTAGRRAAAFTPMQRPLVIASGHVVVPKTSPKPIFNRPPDFPPPRPVSEPSTPNHSQRRWSASAWMLYRPDHGGTGLASGGQLGASQMGVRIAYELTPSQAYAIALHGRVTSALESPKGVEAALGLTYRPKRSLPVALSIERRVAVAEGGRNAFAAYAAGGAGPVAIPPNLELEGYAQAGMVGLARNDVFADGRFALSRRLMDLDNRALLTGIAASGGTQPGLSRLDLGPHLSARQGSARVVLEWRQRIAGNAFPGSGPAVIVAADF